MRRLLRENGLLIVMFGLFVIFLVGQVATGYREYNDDQQEHSQPTISVSEYLGTGHFIEAVFENWESEFLQMGSYVVLTIFLRQKGAADSKKLDGPEEVDREPDPSQPPDGAPWPVQRGGLALKVYKHSLSIALFSLFFLSFALHAIGGASEYNQEQIAHGGQALSTLAFLTTARFWFESFQNWQSEFLSVGMLMVLSIFLRQKGSPESKPVDTAHSVTGDA
jgi:hypothetical protein